MNNISEAFQLAIDMEKLSYSQYMLAADKSHNVIVESVLRSLAHDEESHMHVIERFYQAMQKSGRWPDAYMDEVDQRPAQERAKQIRESTGGKLNPDDSFQDTYSFALNQEQHAYDFYVQQSEIYSEDKELHALFKFLANMESLHMKLLDMLLSSSESIAQRELKEK